MIGITCALITVVAWGAWLAPSQHVPMKSQQTRTFYVTLAVLLLAIVVTAMEGISRLTLGSCVLPFCGGLIWSLSGLSAFVGARGLGMAKAFGIWAPLNIVISILWGIALSGEFLHTGSVSLSLTLVALAAIIGGTLMIIFSGGQSDTGAARKARMIGYLGAFGAGIGFATYFIPIRISGLSMWIATLPLAVGMFVGAIVITAISRTSLKLEQPSHYARVLSTGLLWGIGNYGALLMMERMGTGKGFTIAQLCVVVNALIGIYWEHKPMPGTRAARLILAGVVMATLGAILLGNLK